MMPPIIIAEINKEFNIIEATTTLV